jgi:hypothetical protein
MLGLSMIDHPTVQIATGLSAASFVGTNVDVVIRGDHQLIGNLKRQADALYWRAIQICHASVLLSPW